MFWPIPVAGSDRARERIGVGVSLEFEVDDIQHLADTLLSRRAADAIGRGKKFQILHHRHVVVDTKKIGHVADKSADFFWCRVHAVAANIGFAIRRLQQRGDDTHRCGLSRTIGTDEAKEIASGQIEINALDGKGVPILFR